jgi:hypothetical protein
MYLYRWICYFEGYPSHPKLYFIPLQPFFPSPPVLIPRQPSFVPGQPSSFPTAFLVPRQPSCRYPPAFPAIGCGSRFPTVLVGTGWQVISPPPSLTPGDQEGCSMEGTGQQPPATRPCHPPPSHLGPGEGDGQQQRQQQYFNPRPSARPASSIPLLMPPYCITCSVHVWRGA